MLINAADPHLHRYKKFLTDSGVAAYAKYKDHFLLCLGVVFYDVDSGQWCINMEKLGLKVKDAVAFVAKSAEQHARSLTFSTFGGLAQQKEAAAGGMLESCSVDYLSSSVNPARSVPAPHTGKSATGAKRPRSQQATPAGAAAAAPGGAATAAPAPGPAAKAAAPPAPPGPLPWRWASRLRRAVEKATGVPKKILNAQTPDAAKQLAENAASLIGELESEAKAWKIPKASTSALSRSNSRASDFGDLVALKPQIADALSYRLKEYAEAAELLRQSKLPPPSASSARAQAEPQKDAAAREAERVRTAKVSADAEDARFRTEAHAAATVNGARLRAEKEKAEKEKARQQEVQAQQAQNRLEVARLAKAKSDKELLDEKARSLAYIEAERKKWEDDAEAALEQTAKTQRAVDLAVEESRKTMREEAAAEKERQNASIASATAARQEKLDIAAELTNKHKDEMRQVTAKVEEISTKWNLSQTELAGQLGMARGKEHATTEARADQAESYQRSQQQTRQLRADFVQDRVEFRAATRQALIGEAPPAAAAAPPHAAASAVLELCGPSGAAASAAAAHATDTANAAEVAAAGAEARRRGAASCAALAAEPSALGSHLYQFASPGESQVQQAGMAAAAPGTAAAAAPAPPAGGTQEQAAHGQHGVGGPKALRASKSPEEMAKSKERKESRKRKREEEDTQTQMLAVQPAPQQEPLPELMPPAPAGSGPKALRASKSPEEMAKSLARKESRKRKREQEETRKQMLAVQPAPQQWLQQEPLPELMPPAPAGSGQQPLLLGGLAGPAQGQLLLGGQAGAALPTPQALVAAEVAVSEEEKRRKQEKKEEKAKKKALAKVAAAQAAQAATRAEQVAQLRAKHEAEMQELLGQGAAGEAEMEARGGGEALGVFNLHSHAPNQNPNFNPNRNPHSDPNPHPNTNPNPNTIALTLTLSPSP
jgi:hypothetical protein